MVDLMSLDPSSSRTNLSAFRFRKNGIKVPASMQYADDFDNSVIDSIEDDVRLN